MQTLRWIVVSRVVCFNLIPKRTLPHTHTHRQYNPQAPQVVARYKATLLSTRFVLAPRGNGLHSYRMAEALSASSSSNEWLPTMLARLYKRCSLCLLLLLPSQLCEQCGTTDDARTLYCAIW